MIISGEFFNYLCKY